MKIEEFIKSNKDFTENKKEVTKILRILSLSLVDFNEPKIMNDMIQRIFYKTNIPKKLIKKVCSSLPENKVLFISKNFTSIFKYHKKIISKEINEKLERYWIEKGFK